MYRRALAITALAAAPLLAADLAPTGTLRATFLGENPVQGKVDRQSGAITGPVADLVQELAHRLNVPYQILPAANAGVVIENLKTKKADIGFLAYDPERAAEVDFSRPYALMHNSYVVRADANFKTSADVDRAGTQVGAVKGQSQQLYLSANLKNGKVRIFPTQPPQAELEALLLKGEIDAFGANRQRMVEAARLSPKLRVLPDDFLVVGQAIVVTKENHGLLDALNRFLDEARSSGLVKSSLERAQIAGVDVAP